MTGYPGPWVPGDELIESGLEPVEDDTEVPERTCEGMGEPEPDNACPTDRPRWPTAPGSSHMPWVMPMNGPQRSG